ncbi:MAG: substrate-binding domain-containing protein, partial [Burkholderiales bacterium]
MDKLVFSFLLPALVLAQPALAQEKCDEVYGNGPNKFSLATGSPGELGLLKALAEPFTKQTNSTLCWKKAGSGESLKLLKDKSVDMIMVHAPAAANKAVEEGWAANKRLIGSN